MAKATGGAAIYNDCFVFFWGIGLVHYLHYIMRFWVFAPADGGGRSCKHAAWPELINRPEEGRRRDRSEGRLALRRAGGTPRTEPEGRCYRLSGGAAL